MAPRRHRLARRRAAMGFTQETLAEHLGLERSTVGRWERGVGTPQPWNQPDLAKALGVSQDVLAELLDSDPPDDHQAPGQLDARDVARSLIDEFNWPDRHRAGNAIGAPELWDATVILDESRATAENDLIATGRYTELATAGVLLTGTALVTKLEPFLWPVTPPARQGQLLTLPEADAVERFTTAAKSWQWRRSTLARRVVLSQLATLIRRLRDARQGTAETSRAFRLAAELADIAATMSWDTGNHVVAQHYFTLAVQLSHAGGHTALAAGILLSLARQCYYLRRPDDGLEIVQLAQYATRRIATPRLRAAIATREAWAHALMGQDRPFLRAVAVAEDCHTEGTRDIDASTPSARSLDAAELAGVLGGRYRELAEHEPRFAREAQDRINHALRIRNPHQSRNQVFDLVELARAHLVSHEPERAAELVVKALPLAKPTGRTGSMLRDFHRAAEPFVHMSVIRDTRDAITDLITA
jgi:transcriptional regulator with XRE-family HTH domain